MQLNSSGVGSQSWKRKNDTNETALQVKVHVFGMHVSLCFCCVVYLAPVIMQSFRVLILQWVINVVITSYFSSQWWFVLTWTQSWQNSNGWWLLCVIRMCRLPSRNWAWCHSYCAVHLFTWFWSGNVVSNKNLKYSGVFILTDRVANCWLFSQATCIMSFSTLHSSKFCMENWYHCLC